MRIAAERSRRVCAVSRRSPRAVCHPSHAIRSELARHIHVLAESTAVLVGERQGTCELVVAVAHPLVCPPATTTLMYSLRTHTERSQSAHTEPVATTEHGGALVCAARRVRCRRVSPHCPTARALRMRTTLIAARVMTRHRYTIAKYGMSMCVLGMAEEFAGKIAVNALWYVVVSSVQCALVFVCVCLMCVCVSACVLYRFACVFCWCLT